MNRRELFKGAIAALAAASIPFPFKEDELFGRSPAMDALPDMRIYNYLLKSRNELLDKIINPPLMLDGYRVIPLPTIAQEEALLHVNRLLEEFDGQQEI